MAIIVAGVLIAGAILVPKISGRESAKNIQPEKNNKEIVIKPISAEDHILGSKDAKIVIVEFSDTECPFCKRFHPIMQKIIAEYKGQVAWVYRHFPLDALHSKARKEAEATECAAEQGGNDAFWKYIDRVFEVTPGNDGLDEKELYNIADYAGLDKAKFTECLASGKYASKVDEQSKDGASAGVEGTPQSIILTKDGQKIPLSGAQPFEAVKAEIDRLLK